MRFFLSACLLLVSINANAGLNKWVDADGQVHYSDAPPPREAKAVTLKAPSVASGVSEQKSISERILDLKKKQQANEEAAQKNAKQQEKEQAKQTICNQLHARLTTLETGGRIISNNDKGEPVYLDDDMLNTRIEETRKRISEECP